MPSFAVESLLKGGRDAAMMRRICLWTVAGFMVACAWVMVSLVIGPDYNLVRWPVVEVTAPGWLIGHSLQLDPFWVILLNGAAYAIVGFFFEPFHSDSR
jgi:hypothetical protein